MTRQISFALALMVFLAACSTGPAQAPRGPSGGADRSAVGVSVPAFTSVVRQVEPVAEAICRESDEVSNCDYDIRLITDPRAPSNAFQTLDANGRPILIVTQTLLREMSNTDEAAFVLSHEAAHHIAGHIPRTQTNASGTAVLAGLGALAAGLDPDAVAEAQRVGAFVGSRAYSKSFELEADRLGTVIAARAGYDPLRGAEFFNRLPDPGNAFLGSHPPNDQRIQAVREVAAGL